MAVVVMSMPEVVVPTDIPTPSFFRYFLCDTDAELSALASYSEGDLAYSKQAHMLYFRTNAAWTAVA